MFSVGEYSMSDFMLRKSVTDTLSIKKIMFVHG
jgi:hypothetical protein